MDVEWSATKVKRVSVIYRWEYWDTVGHMKAKNASKQCQETDHLMWVVWFVGKFGGISSLPLNLTYSNTTPKSYWHRRYMNWNATSYESINDSGDGSGSEGGGRGKGTFFQEWAMFVAAKWWPFPSLIIFSLSWVGLSIVLHCSTAVAVPPLDCAVRNTKERFYNKTSN